MGNPHRAGRYSPRSPPPPPMDAPFEFGSPAWYVTMLLAGLAVGAAIAIARAVFRKDE